MADLNRAARFSSPQSQNRPCDVMIPQPKTDPTISSMLSERVDAGDFPSAVYLVAERGQATFADALGDAVREPENHAATLETIYDLASLTKPLITGLLCGRLVELGELTLDSSISNYLLEFDRPDKSHITIRELLTHTSGLPAWRPLHLLAQGRPEGTLSAIANTPLDFKSGESVIYSDLGFIVLGYLLERLTGKRLDRLAAEEIFAPLNLSRTFFNPPAALKRQIAASENGAGYEREMCAKQFPEMVGGLAADSHAWRDGLIWGEVHDGNAHFLGGIAGHAGLFSDAGETFQLANQFLAGQTRILKPATGALFNTDLTPGGDGARSFAWQLASSPESSAGPSLPPDAFGHTGFTGTSCWIDPHLERVFILLTNRTHARALPFANINPVRRAFHTFAVNAMAV